MKVWKIPSSLVLEIMYVSLEENMKGVPSLTS